MAHNKLYRNFIILQQDEKKHAATGEKALSGYAKIEAKSDKCKISFYAQNLKENDDYSIVLICYKKDMKQIVDLGPLQVSQVGKGEACQEYYINNIAGLDFSYEKISGAAICKYKDNEISFLMYGFMNGEDVNDGWKKCKVVKHDGKKEKEVKKEFKKIVKEIKKTEKEHCEEKMEHKHKEEHCEEKVEHKHKEDPCEEKMEHKHKEDPCEEKMEHKHKEEYCEEKMEHKHKEEYCEEKMKHKHKEEHCEKRIEEESKEEQCEEKIEQEAKEEQCEEKIEQEIKEEQCEERIEEAVREDKCEERIEEAVREDKCEEKIEQEVKEEKCEEKTDQKDKEDLCEERIDQKLREPWWEEKIEEEIKEDHWEEKMDQNTRDLRWEEEYEEDPCEYIKQHKEKLYKNMYSSRNDEGVKFEEYESIIDNIREELLDPYDFNLRGTIGEFFGDIAEGFEEIRNKYTDLKYCKWYKVKVNNLEDMCNISNYNKYTVAYYPMLNYYPYIRKYGHFMLGYKCDPKGNLKYIIYGVPGKKDKEEQPYLGKTGFVTWMEVEGTDIGCWLMFYDYKNSTVVVPMK